jgi:hypothetical protein
LILPVVHILVSKIKPCMPKYQPPYGETADGSIDQLPFVWRVPPTVHGHNPANCRANTRTQAARSARPRPPPPGPPGLNPGARGGGLPAEKAALVTNRPFRPPPARSRGICGGRGAHRAGAAHQGPGSRPRRTEGEKRGRKAGQEGLDAQVPGPPLPGPPFGGASPTPRRSRSRAGTRAVPPPTRRSAPAPEQGPGPPRGG